jgi:predicted metalloprotease with PDZ domain
MPMKSTICILNFLLLYCFTSIWAGPSSIHFQISMAQPTTHTFQMKMECKGFSESSIDFKMPVWTPGYYQRLDFAQHVDQFQALDTKGKPLEWEKINDNTWRVIPHPKRGIVLNYVVKTQRSFVATPYVDEERAYILPGGVFMYPHGHLSHDSKILVQPYSAWKQVATGLEAVPKEAYTFMAPNFDVLYDSPLLVGNLEELPAFEVAGKKHRFIGLKLGQFDKVKFMSDLQKIVQAAADLIGDVPYKDYTFIAIGPGGGGIEHLNSTTFAFAGESLNNPQSRLRTLFFLAHEYFHHYNVKRIRPIELGPFNYDEGSRTNQLWISEGLTVYYEYLLLRRAGLCSDAELLEAFRNNIRAFEDKPGRLYQNLVQASFETWSDGPFGRAGDEVNKTISYYDKGPVVGWFFDLRIRHLTQNKKSLDDVMRTLYQEYYLKQQRGFTEEEFRRVCENIAGAPLEAEFQYVNSVAELNYAKYLDYAGLGIDLAPKAVPGAWLGLTTRVAKDSTVVTAVEYDSPAWKAGLRRRNFILEVYNEPAKSFSFANMIKDQFAGDEIELIVLQGQEKRYLRFIMGKKKERSFELSPLANPGKLQREIYEGWVNGKVSP